MGSSDLIDLASLEAAEQNVGGWRLEVEAHVKWRNLQVQHVRSVVSQELVQAGG